MHFLDTFNIIQVHIYTSCPTSHLGSQENYMEKCKIVKKKKKKVNSCKISNIISNYIILFSEIAVEIPNDLLDMML